MRLFFSSKCVVFSWPHPRGGSAIYDRKGGGHSTHTARERALKRGGAEFRAAAAPPHPFASFLVVGPIGPDRELKL